MAIRTTEQGEGAAELLGIRAAVGLLAAGLAAWLWPIGFGGRMLVGGDVTRFFMGLTAVLGEALHDRRLPVWNDLWGFGFPGLAESQMGVYYPPHLLLYGLFGVETAYVVSLAGHTLWGGLGAFWCSRRFGVSPAGSALSAFAWSAGGFFVIHLSHPWGYSAGSWTPWAWGLAGSILSAESRPRRLEPYLLSLVLFLQLLPGHFQIAFMTQVGVALMLFWASWEAFRGSAADREKPPARASAETDPAAGRSIRRPFRGRAFVVSLALAAPFPLAAMQIGPTARLARLADQQRDFAYLAGFAATPFHLVSYVAPGLFHYSPAWRPLVWDPFITSPEEHLAYVGLAPLLLALTAVSQWKRDSQVRVLMFLAAASLILSLGPNVPGYAVLIQVPGFSFFRAPARWALPVSLALALLAGKGFDAWRSFRKPGRSILAFIGFALLWIGGILALIELSLAVPARSDAAAVLRRGFQAVSWAGPRGWDSVVSAARQPIPDPNIPEPLANQNLPDVVRRTPSFTERRPSIYFEELAQTGLVLGLLAIIGILQTTARGRTAAPAAFLLLTFADLIILSRHRMSDLETAPWRPLTEQSPILAELARLPRGTRSVDALRNFPMIVGLAPIAAYRTMDLPVAVDLAQIAHSPFGFAATESAALSALRAAGAGVRIFDPVDNLLTEHSSRFSGGARAEAGGAGSSRSAWKAGAVVADPALAAWQYGSAWVARQGTWATSYRLGTTEEPPARAWLIDLGGNVGELPAALAGSEAAAVNGILDRARPLPSASSRPGSRTVELEDARETGWIIISELSDPQWSARWIGRDGQGEKPVEIRPVLRSRRIPPAEGLYDWGWQAVQAPGPGRWTLTLEYDARDVRQGLLISAAAWCAWIGCFVRSWRRAK